MRECGDGVRWITTGRTHRFEVGTQRVARNQEEWQELWAYFALPAPAPRVNFEHEYAVAQVESPSCVSPAPTLGICADGSVEIYHHLRTLESLCLRFADFWSEARSVVVIAVSRQSPAHARMIPTGTEEDDAPTCKPELTGDDLLKRRLRPGRPRSTPPDLLWQVNAGALAGISSAGSAAAGLELRGGIRYDTGSTGHSDGVIGNLVGVDLRARWLAALGSTENRFTVGLWPWMMTRRDWIFHDAWSRAPVVLGVVVPEGGVVIAPSGSVGGYLGWSFPIALRVEPHFYRTSPYLLSEHWSFEVAPLALLLFDDRNTSGLFMLTLSAGLW